MAEVRLAFLALIFLGVSDLFTILALLIMSLEDILRGEIHYLWLIFLMDFQAFYGYFLIIIILIFYHKIDKYIGGADLLIIALLFNRYSFYRVNLIVLWASIFGLLYLLLSKTKRLRFIPFLLMGFLFSLKMGGL